MHLYNWNFEENDFEKIQQITKNVYEDIQIYTEEYFTTSEQIFIKEKFHELYAENASLLI